MEESVSLVPWLNSLSLLTYMISLEYTCLFCFYFLSFFLSEWSRFIYISIDACTCKTKNYSDSSLENTIFKNLNLPNNARVKGHLEPTHLKSSPLFTFSTKSFGQDSPSIHLFTKIIGSRFTTAKTKFREDSPSWFVFSRSRFTFKQRR